LKIEAALAIGMPLTIVEICKWCVMFCEKRGSGRATPDPDFTEADWFWFKANTENAVKSFEILESRKHSRG
jgi:hypothetical protein